MNRKLKKTQKKIHKELSSEEERRGERIRIMISKVMKNLVKMMNYGTQPKIMSDTDGQPLLL